MNVNKPIIIANIFVDIIFPIFPGQIDMNGIKSKEYKGLQ